MIGPMMSMAEKKPVFHPYRSGDIVVKKEVDIPKVVEQNPGLVCSLLTEEGNREIAEAYIARGFLIYGASIFLGAWFFTSLMKASIAVVVFLPLWLMRRNAQLKDLRGQDEEAQGEILRADALRWIEKRAQPLCESPEAIHIFLGYDVLVSQLLYLLGNVNLVDEDGEVDERRVEILLAHMSAIEHVAAEVEQYQAYGRRGVIPSSAYQGVGMEHGRPGLTPDGGRAELERIRSQIRKLELEWEERGLIPPRKCC